MIGAVLDRLRDNSGRTAATVLPAIRDLGGEVEEASDPNATAGAEITFDAAGASVIKLSGEVDMSNVDSLRTAIEPAVANVPADVIFDLSELAFMDSSGIAMLLQIAAKAQSVRIRQPSALVRRMIEATGLSDVLLLET